MQGGFPVNGACSATTSVGYIGTPNRSLNVSKEIAIACVTERLYMFIQLLLGGQSLL